MYRPHENFVKPEVVSPLEQANRDLLELARRLRVDERVQREFDMKVVVTPCGTPSCAFGWASFWGIAGLSLEGGTPKLHGRDGPLYIMASEAFVLGGERHAMHMFGSYKERSPQDEASIIEAFVAERRART